MAGQASQAVPEAKTRVREEFDEAMEDYRSASKKILSSCPPPQEGEAVLCHHCLQCGPGGLDLNWGHCLMVSLGQEEAAEAARATLWDTRTRPEEDSRYVRESICLSGPGSTSKSSQRSSRKCLGWGKSHPCFDCCLCNQAPAEDQTSTEHLFNSCCLRQLWKWIFAVWPYPIFPLLHLYL